MLRSTVVIALASATVRAQTPPPQASPPQSPPQPPPQQPQQPPPPPVQPMPPASQPATMPYAQGNAALQAPGMQPPPRRSVMDRRWSIGVDLGSESYQADVDGAQKVEFGQLELAGRYRVRRAIELGLALHLGGSSHIGMGGLYFDFRYRFLAEQKLNVYALASLGVLAIAHEDASETEKKGRGSLRLGAGGEYRWSWFALALELRLVGVGQNKDLAVLPMESVGYQLARAKLSGGSLALGANFYF